MLPLKLDLGLLNPGSGNNIMREQHHKTHEIQFDSESKVKNERGRQRTREFEEDAKGLRIRSVSSCRVESIMTGTQRSGSRRNARNARTPSPMPRNHLKQQGKNERSRSRFPGGVIPRAERFVEAEQNRPALGPHTYLTEDSLDRLHQRGRGGIIPKAHRFNEDSVGRPSPGPQSYRAEDALDRMLKAPVRVPISKAARFETKSREQNPGPSTYMTRRAYEKSTRSSRSKSVPFNRAKRDAPIFLFNKVYA